MKKLAVVVIHGQGSAEPDFADDHIKEVNGRVDDSGKRASDIAWKAVHWADLTGPRQKEYYDEMVANHEVDYRRLRRFIITGFGDAAAYQRSSRGQKSIYTKIHQRVRDAIAQLATEVDATSCPLIFVGYSLGSQIASNYIWDTQHQEPPPTGSAFEVLHTLSGLVTFGSTIPLFTFAHDPVEPITFPPDGLDPQLQPKARWLNFYDRDDVLGYPLGALGGEYAKIVEDNEINVGGLLSGWSPLSHQRYWTDDNFTKPVAKFLGSFL